VRSHGKARHVNQNSTQTSYAACSACEARRLQTTGTEKQNRTDIPLIHKNMVGQLLTTSLYVSENVTLMVGSGASKEEKQDLQTVRYD